MFYNGNIEHPENKYFQIKEYISPYENKIFALVNTSPVFFFR